MNNDVINAIFGHNPIAVGGHHSQLMTINGEFVSVQSLGSNQPEAICLLGLNSKYAQSCFSVWNISMPAFTIYDSRKIRDRTNLSFFKTTCGVIPSQEIVWSWYVAKRLAWIKVQASVNLCEQIQGCLMLPIEKR